MPLNWDMTNVEGHDDFAFYTDEAGDTRLTGLSDYLIWMLGLTLGFNEITAENVDAVYARLCVLWEIDGAPLRRTNEAGESEEHYPSKAEVARYVGLHTNGSRYSDEEYAAVTYHRIVQKAKDHAYRDERMPKDDSSFHTYAEKARAKFHRLVQGDFRSTFNYDLEQWLEDRGLRKADWPDEIEPEVLDAADEEIGKGWCLDDRGWPMAESDSVRRAS